VGGAADRITPFRDDEDPDWHTDEMIARCKVLDDAADRSIEEWDKFDAIARDEYQPSSRLGNKVGKLTNKRLREYRDSAIELGSGSSEEHSIRSFSLKGHATYARKNPHERRVASMPWR
jgi:hypothetical protein